jgi:hypothetical protein
VLPQSLEQFGSRDGAGAKCVTDRPLEPREVSPLKCLLDPFQRRAERLIIAHDAGI